MNAAKLNVTVVATFNGGPMDKEQRTIPYKDEIFYSKSQYEAPAKYVRQGKSYDGTWVYMWAGLRRNAAN